jgi:hypothetical protein
VRLAANLPSPAGEEGGVLILWAILTPALLFLLLLVVDVGNWYVHKRHLQMQADAAALAGGAHFGDCFSPDAATAAGANDAMKNAAITYAGNSASTYNYQVGGGAPRVTTLFNSKMFARGTYVDPDVDTQDPCQTPHQMFDVKQTEADVPYILGSIVNALVPGGGTVVPAINARARVQLKKATIVQGSLPLAVPDVDPKHVTATFVNEASGAVVAGPVDLTKGAAAGGLNWWQGSASVSIPADTKVGVRIGLGGLSGACGPANGTGGTGYVCYDYEDSARGLVAIRGVGSPGTLERPTPRVWAMTLCGSGGGPFFAPEDVASPGTTCAASVYAVMEASAPIDLALVKTASAILNGGGLKNVKAPMTYDGSTGYWSTGYVYSVPVDGGPVDVSLEWEYTGVGFSKQTYSKVQRVYSGFEEMSGPVKALSLSSSSGSSGAPYALDAGTRDITVTVGLEGSLDLSEMLKTVMLRMTGGSRTSAVRCDGPGASEFHDAIVYGCTNPYQLNSSHVCPDPAPPPGPPTCVPTQTGSMVGPTEKALNDRFATCPPVNWPDFDVASDPRVVKLMITDFSALGGSGSTDVPITNFAAFYITGWTNATCGNNEPPPPGLNVKRGGIWGHFIKYIAPDPFSDGTEACDPTALTPCIVSLVK